MEHPHARGGRLHVRSLWSALQTFQSSHWLTGGRYAVSLRPSNALQRERGILNSSFTPPVRPHPQAMQRISNRVYKKLKEQTAPTRNARLLWRAGRSTTRLLKRAADPLLPWAQVKTNQKGIYLSVRAEQAPNPSSRIRLVGERDSLGMPRVCLDWRLSDIDKRTVSVLVAELDAQMRREKSGSVEPCALALEERSALGARQPYQPPPDCGLPSYRHDSNVD